MARIHAINLYPRPAPTGKGQLLKLTSGQPGTGVDGGQAPAFSSAQQRAEKREAARVIEGAPAHIVASGLPRGPVQGSAGARGVPVRPPPSFERGLAGIRRRLRGR